MKHLTEYYNQIVEKAVAAGEKALYECIPTPQTFYSADLNDKPFGEIGPPDPEGDCGGAYITGINGNDPFVKWAKIYNPTLITKGIYKGYDILGLTNRMSKTYRGQSAERYAAFARAAAKVLNEHGIKCGVKTYLS